MYGATRHSRACGNQARQTNSLSLQLDLPIQPIPPRLVQVPRREGLAVLVELPARRADRADEVHVSLLRSAAALLHVAGRAGGGDVLPRRPAAEAAGDHVVEGQVLLAAAVLAGKPVAQEQVEIGRAH